MIYNISFVFSNWIYLCIVTFKNSNENIYFTNVNNLLRMLRYYKKHTDDDLLKIKNIILSFYIYIVYLTQWRVLENWIISQ